MQATITQQRRKRTKVVRSAIQARRRVMLSMSDRAAALALLRRSLKSDERVKKDRAVVKSVNRVEIALRK